MATSTRVVCGFSTLCKLFSRTVGNHQHQKCNIYIQINGTRGYAAGKTGISAKKSGLLTLKRVTGLTAAVAGGFAYRWAEDKVAMTPTIKADSGALPKQIPRFKIARSIKSNTDDTGLKLTLYQYQTCPFCCKLRAYLDYRGFSYDVVEVNSVWRTQTKWSSYKKVPILVVEGQGPDGYIQLNDSSVVCSILESFLIDRSQSIEKLQSYYPVLESKNQRGKLVYEWPNRFFIMYGESKAEGTDDTRKEERKWRDWTDAVLVHTLSPNIYRTTSEAVQAFNWFSEAGEWEQHFGFFERKVVIYVGSIAMYFIGKMLIKKYDLKENVRESLYDACNEWTKAIGKKRKFLGGNNPNMADLSVYGVLSAIEGCPAFQDAVENTDIGGWYNSMKSTVNKKEGAMAMSSFNHS